LDALDERLTQMEEKINSLSDEIYQISKNNSYAYDMTKSLKDQYTNIDSRVVTLENYLYEGRSSESIDKLLDLDQRVQSLENQIKNVSQQKVNNFTNTDLDQRVSKLEIQITELQNVVNNIPKNDQKILLDTVNSLTEKVNNLEQSFQNSEFYFLENGNIKELVQEEVDKLNLEKYVENIVDYKTEETVSKFYYQNQSEDILNVKSLENKVVSLNKEVDNVKYDLQKVITQPPNSFNEKYLGQIQNIEMKIDQLYRSVGAAEASYLFENSNEVRYQVKSGDTLISISNAFKLGNKGVQIILQANNLQSTNIKVGQELIIPVNNIEEYIRWPFPKTSLANYENVVVRFGERNAGGVSSGIGVLVQTEQVYPVLPGRVIETGKLANNNWYIKIDHGNSIVSVIGNIKTPYIDEGKWVDSNTSLGIANAGSIVTVELWKNGEPRDPLKLFYNMIGDFQATYYTEWDDKLVYSPTFRLTRSGEKPTPYKTIAADPDVLPLGTIVYIPELSDLPNKGYFEVQDTGAKVLG
ncbi:MAG: LysM peptidoglycan-binding domain-containing protein, partial [Thermotogota bacterium]|nr:LysM peptidoglycan-binding domain-containing protein [Thermotogota bacterium]